MPDVAHSVPISRVTRLRNRLRKRLAPLLFFLPPLGFLGIGMPFAALAWYGGFYFLWLLGAWILRPSPGLLVLRQESLLLERKNKAVEELGELESGLLVPVKTGVELQLLTKSGTTWFLETSDAAGAAVLLERLKLTAAHRRVVISEREGALPFGTTLLVGLLSCLVMFAFLRPWIALAQAVRLPAWQVALLIAAPLVGGLLGYFRSKELTLIAGSDGVLLRGLFSHRFYPLGCLRAVQSVEEGLLLSVRKGRKERISRESLGLTDDELNALVRRLKLTLRLGRATPVPVPNWIVRGTRSLAQWRAELTAMVQENAQYRALAYDHGRLLQLLMSGAELEPRLGAAIVLASDYSAREHLRVTANTVASDHFRHALIALAEGAASDELLEKALCEALQYKTEG